MRGNYTSILNKDKVGNLFVYLASRIDNLFLTKLLKLTYIIDELSVKETNSPVTWLNYKVWKNGPVAPKIHHNFTYENATEFTEFIDLEIVPQANNGLKIKAKKEFDDSEFTDYEIELINRVVSKYGSLNSSQLIQLLHEENTLWHKIVEQRGLAKIFESNEDANTSPYEIDLKELIKEPYMREMFDEMNENMRFKQCLEA